jgi:hypothetical protein
VKAISRHDLNDTDKIDRRESFVLLETLLPEHFHHVHLAWSTQSATRSREGVGARPSPEQGHGGGDVLRRPELHGIG